MASYLIMDGTDDWISCPSMTYDEIVMVCEITAAPAAYHKYLQGASTGWFQRNGSNQDQWSTGTPGWSTCVVNGVSETNSTNFMTLNTQLTVDLKGTSTANSVTGIFATSAGGSPVAGNIYDIKIYNAGILVAHYDLSSQSNVSGQTLLDTSGNGNNATLNGGTPVWGGTSGSNASITSVTAPTTNAAPTPTITTQQQVNVASVVASVSNYAPVPTVSIATNISINTVTAGSTASSVSPSVSAQRQISVSAVVTNITASANVPSVGSVVNASVSAMTASINNAANAPTIATQVQVNIFAVSASANAQEPSPAVEVQSQVTISSVTAAANASMQAPYFGKFGEIIQQISFPGNGISNHL